MFAGATREVMVLMLVFGRKKLEPFETRKLDRHQIPRKQGMQFLFRVDSDRHCASNP